MGFYAPPNWSAMPGEHGVEVLPVDVNRSQWDCTLEERRKGVKGAKGAKGRRGRPALRLGFRMLYGLARQARPSGSWQARGGRAFSSLEGFSLRGSRFHRSRNSPSGRD